LHSLAQSLLVRFAGKLTWPELCLTLAEIGLVAVPSLWYENQPLTILEAFAAGVPVIASDLGALPELVEDGRTGWRVKAGDVDAWAQALTEVATGVRPRIDCVEAQVSDVMINHLPAVLALYLISTPDERHTSSFQ